MLPTGVYNEGGIRGGIGLRGGTGRGYVEGGVVIQRGNRPRGKL